MLDIGGWDVVTARLNAGDRHGFTFEVLHHCAVLNMREDQAQSAAVASAPVLAAQPEFPLALLAAADTSSSIYAFHARATGTHTMLSKRMKYVEVAFASCKLNGHLLGLPGILEAAYVSGLSTKRKHELSSGIHIAFKEELAPIISAMKGMREKLLDFCTGCSACLLVPVDEDMYPTADAAYGWMFIPGEMDMRRFLATPSELAPLFNKFNTLMTEDPKVRSAPPAVCCAVGPN
jgi:hypothetical protein